MAGSSTSMANSGVAERAASTVVLSAEPLKSAGGAVPPFSSSARLWRRFPVALALFLSINALLAVYGNSRAHILTESVVQNSESEVRQQGPWSWWVARAYLARSKAPDIALFGSSQMGSATFCADASTLKEDIDCVLHRKMSALEKDLQAATGRRVETANLAMSGEMISDAVMISRALFTANRKPKVVVASICPRDFIDNDLPGPSATEIFKWFAPYAAVDDLQSVAYPDWLSRSDWLLGHYVPMKRGQSLAQSTINSILVPVLSYLTPQGARKNPGSVETKSNKVFLQAILGSVGDVKPGDWIIPKLMPPLWVDNTREYVYRYRKSNPPVYKLEQQFFKTFLSDMKKQGIQVFVVEMPTLPMNSGLLPPMFWEKYQAWVIETCRQYDAPLCDLSHSSQFTKDDFLDTVHLNANGGNKFFHMLTDVLAQSPEYARAINKPRPPNESDPDDMGPSAAIGSWH